MKKIQSLDSIRFFMIMLIVLSHFTLLNQFEETGWLYNKFLSHGGFAVNYFFVLSGFGLMYSYVQKNKNLLLNPTSLVDFAVKHIRKLYGLYVVLLFVCIPYDVISYYDEMGFLGGKFWLNELLKLILCFPLLQSATGMTQFSHAFNGVSWFLSSLFCIYMVCPFLLVNLNKIKRLSSIMSLLVFNIVLLFFVREFFTELESRTFFNDLAYGSPYCRVLYVSAGMLVAQMSIYLKSNFIYDKKCGGTIVEFFAILFMLCSYVMGAFFWPFNGLFTHVVWLLASCLGIFVFSFENGAISKFLQMGRVKRLGALSMYLFLVHYPIKNYMTLVLNKIDMEQFLWAYLIGIFLTLTLSFLISFALLKRKEDGLR